MSYEVIKIIKGNPYRYLVHSERDGEKVRQVFEAYLGRADGLGRVRREKTITKKESPIERAISKIEEQTTKEPIIVESTPKQEITREDVFKYQNDIPEKTVHLDWDKANSFRYELEGVGDILRELTKSKPADTYIKEKMYRVEKLLSSANNFNEQYNTANQYEKEKLNKIISEYENQPTINKEQENAKELILSVAKGNYDNAKRNLAQLKEQTPTDKPIVEEPEKVISEPISKMDKRLTKLEYGDKEIELTIKNDYPSYSDLMDNRHGLEDGLYTAGDDYVYSVEGGKVKALPQYRSRYDYKKKKYIYTERPLPSSDITKIPIFHGSTHKGLKLDQLSVERSGENFAGVGGNEYDGIYFTTRPSEAIGYAHLSKDKGELIEGRLSPEAKVIKYEDIGNRNQIDLLNDGVDVILKYERGGDIGELVVLNPKILLSPEQEPTQSISKIEQPSEPITIPEKETITISPKTKDYTELREKIRPIQKIYGQDISSGYSKQFIKEYLDPFRDERGVVNRDKMQEAFKNFYTDKMPAMKLEDYLVVGGAKFPVSPYPDYRFRATTAKEWDNMVLNVDKSGDFWSGEPRNYGDLKGNPDDILLVTKANSKGNLRYEAGREDNGAVKLEDIVAVYRKNPKTNTVERYYSKEGEDFSELDGVRKVTEPEIIKPEDKPVIEKEIPKEETKEPWQLTKDEFDNPPIRQVSSEPEPPISPTYYHGTNADIKFTDLKPVNKSTNFDKFFGDIDTERYGIFLSNSKEFSGEYGKNIIPIKIDTNKLADAADEKSLFIESLDPLDKNDREVWINATNSRNMWGMFENELGKRFTDYLKNKDYEGAYFEESLPPDSTKSGKELTSDTIVVFDPSKLSSGYHKSVIQQALDSGKPVPPEVLKDYPDLQPIIESSKPDTVISLAKPVNKPLPKMEDNFLKPLSEYTDTLYREMNIESLSDFAPSHFGALADREIYFSNTPTLALGQGTNKGVLVEFNSKDIRGQVNKSKPTWELLYDSGEAEFIAKRNNEATLKNNIKSITIAKDAKTSKSNRAIINRWLSTWNKVQNNDGSTTYTPPVI